MFLSYKAIKESKVSKHYNKDDRSQTVVAHALIPLLVGKGRQISETSLVYRVNSRVARAIQKNPV